MIGQYWYRLFVQICIHMSIVLEYVVLGVVHADRNVKVRIPVHPAETN